MSRAIVAAASWEPRFISSLQALLDEKRASVAIIVFSAAYEEWTEEARAEASRICSLHECEYRPVKLNFDLPGELWKGVVSIGTQLREQGFDNLALDGSTMPRELTWFFLHLADTVGFMVDYHYVPVGSYGDWLSKESLAPRLVLKRSGILFPDKPTCVIAMSGFDLGRLNQVLTYFEPARVEIARQVGDRYENISRNTPQLSEYARQAHIFDFDGFDLGEASREVLRKRIMPLLSEYNVLLASLGPKLAAVTAFEITEEIPSVGLVYIPSSSYNREYSKGADLDARTIHRVAFRR